MAKAVKSDLDMESTTRLLNLLDPALAQHAATKNYVDVEAATPTAKVAAFYMWR